MLSPLQLKDLSHAIGDRFDYPTLQLALYKCLGENAIDSVANRNWPLHETSRACLDRTVKDGVTVSFLRLLIDSRTADQEFHAFVATVVPDVKTARTQTRDAVNAVVAALFATETLISNDPKLRAQVLASQESLADLQAHALTLSVFKQLHDHLHHLQPPSFDTLRRALAPDALPFHRRIIADFAMKIETSQDRLVSIVALLPKGLTARMQLYWIDRLILQGKALAAAVTSLDLGGGKLALAEIQRIFASIPGQLNASIFETMRQLPLTDVIQSLRDFAAARGGSQPGTQDPLTAGEAGLVAIRDNIVARVVEHQTWQNLAENLFTLSQLFERPPDELFSDIALQWPGVEASFAGLYGAHPDAPWVLALKSHAKSIATALKVLELT